jgi:hypothetical protein
MVHNADIDTLEVCWKYIDVGDLMYGVIYDLDANGQPKTRLGRTNDSAAAAGKVKLTFASSVSLSENTTYAIGIEIIDGDASTHTVNNHKDTLRYSVYWQFTGELTSTWDTANDVVSDGVVMPYWNIIGATTVAYDTTARDSSHTLTKDNYLDSDGIFGPWSNHGTAAFTQIGQVTAGGPGYTMRPIVSTENATEAYIEAFFDDTADVAIICTVMFDWSSQSGMDADDSLYLYALMVQFHETESHWEKRDTSNTWGDPGADLSGTDHYAMRLGGFIESDTATNGYYVITADTGSYGPMLQMCDSFVTGTWGVYGFYIREKTGLLEGEWIKLTSGESGSAPPYFSYGTLALTQQAVGGATTNRHGADRHGAYRH